MISQSLEKKTHYMNRYATESGGEAFIKHNEESFNHLKNESQRQYKPFPTSVKLRARDGIYTLHADELIFANETIGVAHILINSEKITTALGAFYKRGAKNPNCYLVKDGNRFYLKSLRTIEMYEELTCNENMDNYGKRDF